MNDFVPVKIFTTRLEAEIAKGVLETNNIKSFISADDEGGMASFLNYSNNSGVSLLVNKKDLQKAQEILVQE